MTVMMGACKMGVCGGGGALKTDACSTFERLAQPSRSSFNLQMHRSTSHCLFLKVCCSVPRQPTLICHSFLSFCVFFLLSLTLNETTMSRLCSKDDQKSVVSLTHYYSTQCSKAAHTGASRGLLYCVVHGHAHVHLRLLHFGAILFFYFHNHSPGCGVQDGMCRRWGLNEVGVKFEK